LPFAICYLPFLSLQVFHGYRRYLHNPEEGGAFLELRRMDPREQVTVLGPDARFKGELSIEGTGRILGSFEGTIRAGELHIGPGATCQATIEANTIIIDGTHQGDLTARECLQLSSQANVQGDVTACALAVAEGATFVGRCVVGPDAFAGSTRTAATPEHRIVARKTTARSSDWLESVPPPATTPAPDWLGQPGNAVRPWANNTSTPAPAAEPSAA
jgi:cytoskeletal protein CcmA (bactofilin family)